MRATLRHARGLSPCVSELRTLCLIQLRQAGEGPCRLKNKNVGRAHRVEQKLLELSGTTRAEQLYSTSATPLAVRSSTSTVPVRVSGSP